MEMIDRKKLIEQLETDAMATNTGYVEVPLFQFSEILALLKEQNAVKPKCKERMGGFVAGLCPTCGTALNNVLNVKACGKCGQAVKWE